MDLMPCDALDFVQAWPIICTNGIVALWYAMAKEPTATAAFQRSAVWEALASAQRPESQCNLEASSMRKALEQAVQAVDGAPNVAELKQLTRQGVARFTGVAATCRLFGILLLQRSKGSLRLGLTRQRYEFTGDDSTLKKLLEGASSLEKMWRDVLDAESYQGLAQSVHSWMQSLQAACPDLNLPFKSEEGYLRKLFVRKVLIARLCRDLTVSWQDVSVDTLRTTIPDQNEFLQDVPGDLPASELSNLLFGREDWSVFASFFGCVCKELQDKHGGKLSALEAMVENGEFQRVVSSLGKHLRVNPHVATVAEHLL